VGDCRAEFTPSASLRTGLSKGEILRFAQNDTMEKAQNDTMEKAQNDKGRGARNDIWVEGEELGDIRC
jgi:hypothetical protein